MERLKPLLSSYAGRPLDLLYSRLGGINGSFFSEGWGNLRCGGLCSTCCRRRCIRVWQQRLTALPPPCAAAQHRQPA